MKIISVVSAVLASTSSVAGFMVAPTSRISNTPMSMAVLDKYGNDPLAQAKAVIDQAKNKEIDESIKTSDVVKLEQKLRGRKQALQAELDSVSTSMEGLLDVQAELKAKGQFGNPILDLIWDATRSFRKSEDNYSPWGFTNAIDIPKNSKTRTAFDYDKANWKTSKSMKSKPVEKISNEETIAKTKAEAKKQLGK